MRCNPDDVVRLGLADGDTVVLTNAYGPVRATLRVDDRVRRGVVSITHGWISANADRPSPR